jgi:hypothetical protein
MPPPFSPKSRDSSNLVAAKQDGVRRARQRGQPGPPSIIWRPPLAATRNQWGREMIPIRPAYRRRDCAALLSASRPRPRTQYGPCPVCNGTNRFSFNTRKQVRNCGGCGRGAAHRPLRPRGAPEPGENRRRSAPITRQSLILGQMKTPTASVR